jgi:hypothetical protein
MPRFLAALAATLMIALPCGAQTVHFAGREIPNTFTAIQTVNPSTTPGLALKLDIDDIGTTGTRDSHTIEWCGKANDGTERSRCFRIFTDVTANGGAGQLKVQTRLTDGGSWTDVFAIATTGVATTALSDFDPTPPSSAGQIPIWDGSKYVPGDPLVQGLTAHDAAGATTNPVAIGGFASAAAPSDVSADTDIVRTWHLRNGSPVVNLATAGTLYDARSIRALSSATDSITAAAAATSPVSVRQSDGSTAQTFDSQDYDSGAGTINRIGVGLVVPASGGPAVIPGDSTNGLKVQVTTAPVTHVIADSGTITTITNQIDSNLKQVGGGNTSTVATGVQKVATADSAGSAFTSNSTTYTAKVAQDVNVLGTLGTAFSTAGKVDVKAADGDVFVRQTTGTNLHTVTDSGSVTAATLSAETTKVIGTVRALGNAGGIFDTTQNATVPANAISMGCNFTTSPATITTGNQGAAQCNSKGELLTQLTDGTTNVAVISGTTALKTDMSSVAGTATVTAASGVQKVGIVGNAGAIVDGATGAAPPANVLYAGGVTSGATGGFLTGIPVCTEFVSINISSATTTLVITGVSGRQVYICGLSLVTAAANNVAFITGTGATCGTSTAGMTGGTSAASGYNFAANGGIAQGSGIGAINRTETAGDSVCIVTSAATQLSGALSYAIY